MISPFQELKLNLKVLLKDRTRKERKNRVQVRFQLQDIRNQPVIQKTLERHRIETTQFKAELQKWEFIQLTDDEKCISYRPKYKEIINWQSLVNYLKQPTQKLKGLELEDGIELDTYWEILEDYKKKLGEADCQVRMIEIKGTDKRFLYFMGPKNQTPFTKVQFLSKCDKIINTSKRFYQTAGNDRHSKKPVIQKKQNQWVEGWAELRDKYFKQIEGKK